MASVAAVSAATSAIIFLVAYYGLSLLSAGSRTNAITKFTLIDANDTTVAFRDPGSPGPMWLIVAAPPAGTLDPLAWPDERAGAAQ